MKNLLCALAAASMALAPALAFACEYDSAASMSRAEQLGLAPAPAATKVPLATVAKTAAPRTGKQATAKSKAAADTRIAAATTN